MRFAQPVPFRTLRSYALAALLLYLLAVVAPILVTSSTHAQAPSSDPHHQSSGPNQEKKEEYVVQLPATYRDPKGAFTVLVPGGWHATTDDLGQTVLTFDAAPAITVTIMTSQQNASNALTAQETVEVTTREFKDQCPTFKQRESGQGMLAGQPGRYAVFTCSDARSPAVAQTAAMLSRRHMLVQLTLITPLRHFYAIEPQLEAIASSLSLVAEPAEPPHGSNPPAERAARLRRACVVEAVSNPDCARLIANPHLTY